MDCRTTAAEKRFQRRCYLGMIGFEGLGVIGFEGSLRSVSSDALVESFETTGAILAFDDVFYEVLRRIVAGTLMTMK